MPGDVAVQQVGEAGRHIDPQSHPAIAGELPVGDHQKDRDQRHAQKGEFVGSCHGHRGHDLSLS